MAEQIPLENLIPGRWYVGRGRRGNVGRWDGTRFLTIDEKFGELVIKSEPYYSAETGTFQPFALVDEGVMIEPFGRVGWDANYGRRMEFGVEPDDSSPFPRVPIPSTTIGAEVESDVPRPAPPLG